MGGDGGLTGPFISFSFTTRPLAWCRRIESKLVRILDVHFDLMPSAAFA